MSASLTATIQKCAGIATAIGRSGNKKLGALALAMWQCPMFVRQTFVESAEKTVKRSAPSPILKICLHTHSTQTVFAPCPVSLRAPPPRVYDY